ncbi:MAG: hypothetical protein AAB221_13650 [Bacteroidota bacterium]
MNSESIQQADHGRKTIDRLAEDLDINMSDIYLLLQQARQPITEDEFKRELKQTYVRIMDAKRYHEWEKWIEHPVSAMTVWRLEFGTKILFVLSFAPKEDEADFGTHIVTNLDNKKKKITGETSVIYLAARKIMEQIAFKEGRTMIYALDTDSPVLTQWAITKGNQIFQWKKISVYADGNKISASEIPSHINNNIEFNAEAVICPQ